MGHLISAFHRDLKVLPLSFRRLALELVLQIVVLNSACALGSL